MVPDGASDSVAKGTTYVIRGEIEAGYHGNVLVFGGGLDVDLGWIYKHAASNSEEGLAGNNSKGCRKRHTTTDVDQDTEAGEVENSSKDDKEFKATNSKNDDADDAASNNTTEGEDRRDPSCTLDRFVDNYNKESIKEATLQIPGSFKYHRNAKGAPDSTILQETKWNHGMLAAALPIDPNGEAKDADDKRCNNPSSLPLSWLAACNSKRHKDKCEDCN